MSKAELLATVLIVAGVTALIRALPFLVFSSGQKAPAFVTWMGQKLPGAVMMMLVVYCLKDVSFGRAADFVPALVGVGVTAALHGWRRQMILSIAGGTAVYMVLIRLLG